MTHSHGVIRMTLKICKILAMHPKYPFRFHDMAVHSPKATQVDASMPLTWAGVACNPRNNRHETEQEDQDFLCSSLHGGTCRVSLLLSARSLFETEFLETQITTLLPLLNAKQKAMGSCTTFLLEIRITTFLQITSLTGF